MLYCNGIEELFEANRIYVDKDGDLIDVTPSSLYHIEGGILYFKNRISAVNKIFEYKNGEFKLLYEKPDLPDISTIIKNGDFIKVKFDEKHKLIGVVVGDKIYYKNGGFDELDITIGNPRYIEEIRRPNSYNGGFNDYDDMPVIWSKNVRWLNFIKAIVLKFDLESTGVVRMKTSRNFIGIEKDEKYFNIAKERLGVM